MQSVRAILLAISTYTRIPVPQVKWDDDAMKLAIAFLPLVGAVIGGVVFAWQFICRCFEVSGVLFAAVTVAIPILITGGIHLDGYCDTSDALASWQSKERKLEILKDPHIGAFAVIRLCVYLLLSFALLYELFEKGYDTGIALVFPLSRCFAAWSAILMRSARKDGMLAAFTAKTDRLKASVILAFFTVSAITAWVRIILYGFTGLLLCCILSLWYKKMTAKNFGGVTGDTTGYFLQNAELFLLVGLLIGGELSKWL